MKPATKPPKTDRHTMNIDLQHLYHVILISSYIDPAHFSCGDAGIQTLCHQTQQSSAPHTRRPRITKRKTQAAACHHSIDLHPLGPSRLLDKSFGPILLGQFFSQGFGLLLDLTGARAQADGCRQVIGSGGLHRFQPCRGSNRTW